MVVSCSPFNLQRAAVHADFAPARCPSGECCRHRRGTSPCAASHRYAAAAFPHTGADGSVGQYLRELDVAALREIAVALHHGTVSCDVYRVDVVEESHEVWISHTYESSLKPSALSQEYAPTEVGILTVVLRQRFEHVNGDALHCLSLAVEMQHQRLYAGEGFQFYLRLVGESTLIEIFPDAARCVSAHHRLRPVGIENPHSVVGSVGGGSADEHQSVASDTLVAVAPSDGSRIGVVYII